jgi:hypothetical protein
LRRVVAELMVPDDMSNDAVAVELDALFDGGRACGIDLAHTRVHDVDEWLRAIGGNGGGTTLVVDGRFGMRRGE